MYRIKQKLLIFVLTFWGRGPSLWPRNLRRGPVAARSLEFRVRIPPGARMSAIVHALYNNSALVLGTQSFELLDIYWMIWKGISCAALWNFIAGINVNRKKSRDNLHLRLDQKEAL
jgi:hypothetical protein